LQELELLATIPISAGNSILILDKNGNIEWVNSAFEQLYGYTISELDSSETNDSSDFIKILNETDKNFFKNNASFSFSRTILNKNGVTVWIQSTLTPIKVNSDVVERFIVIETDITQQKEIEDELVQRWENTQTLTEHLESVKDYIEEQIKELSAQKRALEIAKEKSEDVLNKVLPYEVAIQLKKKGYASPRHYKKVTILNINIRNFFKMTHDIPIENLVQQLHEVLVGFDNILEQHYVEKIKTVGGSYLGAGGVPLRNRSNPIDVVLSALEILGNITSVNEMRKSADTPKFELGFGIHTGKVIAGVVGKTKLTYDIWGDTVNIASTIEHNVPANGIFISEATYQEIEPYFEAKPSEKLVLGSAEEIKLFEIIKIKDKFASDAKGIKPNKDFTHILSKL
jgi:PAS domain S-box-containing protein